MARGLPPADNVGSEEDADEAIGDLRELLELEDLLVAPNPPPSSEG